jgi:hypothetical protein
MLQATVMSAALTMTWRWWRFIQRRHTTSPSPATLLFSATET